MWLNTTAFVHIWCWSVIDWQAVASNVFISVSLCCCLFVYLSVCLWTRLCDKFSSSFYQTLQDYVLLLSKEWIKYWSWSSSKWLNGSHFRLPVRVHDLENLLKMNYFYPHSWDDGCILHVVHIFLAEACVLLTGSSCIYHQCTFIIMLHRVKFYCRHLLHSCGVFLCDMFLMFLDNFKNDYTSDFVFIKEWCYPKCLAGLWELCHCVNAVYCVFYSTVYYLFLSVFLPSWRINVFSSTTYSVCVCV